ncbi:hypothetical protein E2320_015895, partial [Naja naja]
LPKESGLKSSLCSSLNLQAETRIVPIKSHAQIAHIKPMHLSKQCVRDVASARLHHTLIHRSYKISVPLACYLYNIVPLSPPPTKHQKIFYFSW